MHKTRLVTVEILLAVAHMIAAALFYNRLLAHSRRILLYLALLLDR